MLKRVFSLAVLAVAGMFSAALAIVSTCADAVYAGAAHLVRSIFAGPPAFAQAEAQRQTSSRPLVAAKSFLRTLEQRKRPSVTPNWRMCPSN